MPDGCDCAELCFLCACAEAGVVPPGRRIDPRESAALYWCQKYGAETPADQGTIREAIQLHPSYCDTADALVRDQEDSASNPDLTMAVRVRDRRRLFLWHLRRMITDAQN